MVNLAAVGNLAELAQFSSPQANLADFIFDEIIIPYVVYKINDNVEKSMFIGVN